MTIDIYLYKGSPPCQTVLMVAKYLGIDLNKICMDWEKKEALKPEFLKINPQHCVPTINDNGFYLWESRAIITYLAEKYAPNSGLYPKDLQARAVVNRLLYFDIEATHKTLSGLFTSVVHKGERNEEKEKENRNMLKIIDGYLENSSYVAGEHLTLADFSILTKVTLTEMLGIDMTEFPHIQSWSSKVKSQLPFYDEINEEGLQILKKYIDKNLEDRKK